MVVRIADDAGLVPVLAKEVPFLCNEREAEQKVHYWQGASGRRYLHSVYSLLECPQLPKANYILVARQDDGFRRVLQIGQTIDNARSLNLAHLRHASALIGANEVHIHVQAEGARARYLVEADLQAGIFAALTARA